MFCFSWQGRGVGIFILGLNSFTVVLCIYKVSVIVPCDTTSKDGCVLRNTFSLPVLQYQTIATRCQ